MLERGLVGFVSIVVNDSLKLDAIALRRTLDGRPVLAFPARRDARGRQHSLFRPINDEARREIERQVFAALGIEEDTA